MLWINLGSALFGIQRVLPHLERSAFGAAIKITSIHPLAGHMVALHNGTSKPAVVGLTRQLSAELASRRIRVNAVGPGIVEAPRYATMPGYARARGDSCIPLDRVGFPADIANAALLLASDNANWITGQTLWLDGGTTALMPPDPRDEGTNPSE